MSYLEIQLISIGLAMDAFIVSLACGIKNKYNGLIKYMVPPIVFGSFQGGMFVLGWLLASTIGVNVVPISNIIAIVILLIVGLNMIINQEHECNYNFETIGVFILLGIATSIDAFATGFSFSCVNFMIDTSVVIVSITTFIICVIGVYLGSKLKKKLLFLNKIDVIGGIIIICIAVKLFLDSFI